MTLCGKCGTPHDNVTHSAHCEEGETNLEAFPAAGEAVAARGDLAE